MSKIVDTCSKRKYLCIWNENGELEKHTVLLGHFISSSVRTNDYEYIYAMQERVDEILDMKADETIHFQFNRDDKNSKGIILRIQ